MRPQVQSLEWERVERKVEAGGDNRKEVKGKGKGEKEGKGKEESLIQIIVLL